MKLKSLIIFLSLIIMSGNNLVGYCQNSQSGQPNEQAKKIKNQILKIGLANDLTTATRSGESYHGTIIKIEEEYFEIVEVDLKQIIKISYSDTKKVRKGYGQKNIFGKRISPLTSVVVGVAFFGSLMGVALWGASQTR